MSTSLVLIHCGSNTPALSQSVSATSSSSAQVAQQKDASSLRATYGTYEGKLYLRTDTDHPIAQPYTLIISPGHLVLDSEGDAGPVHMESDLSHVMVDPTDFNAGADISGHGYVSTIQKIPNLSESPIAIELIIAVKNGQYLPTQSKIRIMDCGFSQSGSCESTDSAPDARFGTILGKR